MPPKRGGRTSTASGIIDKSLDYFLNPMTTTIKYADLVESIAAALQYIAL